METFFQHALFSFLPFPPVIGEAFWGTRMMTQEEKQSGENKNCLQSLGKWKMCPEKVRIGQDVEESSKTDSLELSYSVMVCRDN